MGCVKKLENLKIRKYKILGLDLSLCATGVCVLCGDKIILLSTIKPKVKGMNRLLYIRDEINKVLSRYDFDVICIEGYSFGSRAGQAFSIGELGGIVKIWIHEKIHLGYYPVKLIIPPTTLKKFITGKGNSSKDIVMMKTLQKYKIEFTNNNECDAFGLAKMGQAYLGGTDINYEKEALKKVEILK